MANKYMKNKLNVISHQVNVIKPHDIPLHTIKMTKIEI